jgi:tRNA dimethylallyltransferase
MADHDMAHSNKMPAAICLMGPTAAGKTDLAVSLLDNLPCEIISVDSALIYKGMDIGTAKPEKEILLKAPHRLIDIIAPSESYSVSQFYHDALREMNDIVARGNVPLLVGGTMMYFKILQNGIANLPSADEKVRSKIKKDADEHGWPYIHEQLAAVDPESAARIRPKDPQRLQRALEVFRVTGITMTQLWADQKDVTKGLGRDIGGVPAAPFDFINLAISPTERATLHARIAERFGLMLDAGFVEEVECFYRAENMHADLPSMRCVGYRQVWDYLDGKLNKDEMMERGVIATRQLAKRQLTWLRSWPNLHQLETNDSKVLAKALKIVENATY